MQRGGWSAAWVPRSRALSAPCFSTLSINEDAPQQGARRYSRLAPWHPRLPDTRRIALQSFVRVTVIRREQTGAAGREAEGGGRGAVRGGWKGAANLMLKVEASHWPAAYRQPVPSRPSASLKLQPAPITFADRKRPQERRVSASLYDGNSGMNAITGRSGDRP